MIQQIDGTPNFTIDTQGLGRTPVGLEVMVVYPFASCGSIQDGVGFDIGTGGWVVRLEDLEEMVRVARELRSLRPAPTEAACSPKVTHDTPKGFNRHPVASGEEREAKE